VHDEGQVQPCPFDLIDATGALFLFRRTVFTCANTLEACVRASGGDPWWTSKLLLLLACVGLVGLAGWWLRRLGRW
jgi:hypothetical protein